MLERFHVHWAERVLKTERVWETGREEMTSRVPETERIWSSQRSERARGARRPLLRGKDWTHTAGICNYRPSEPRKVKRARRAGELV